MYRTPKEEGMNDLPLMSLNINYWTTKQFVGLKLLRIINRKRKK